MQNEVNTPQAPAATLTEKELWALFVSHAMQTTYSMGPLVETYQPDDLLREAEIDSFANEIADSLLESEYPEDELRTHIGVMRNYLDNLELLAGTFTRLKDSLEIDSDDEEGRYRVPVIHGEAQATA